MLDQEFQEALEKLDENSRQYMQGYMQGQEPASTHLFDPVTDLPFDDLINYPIS
jgi:hypothetical protein